MSWRVTILNGSVRYVKLTEVADMMPTSARSAGARLASKGIHPVLSRDEYDTPFYDREVIDVLFGKQP